MQLRAPRLTMCLANINGHGSCRIQPAAYNLDPERHVSFATTAPGRIHLQAAAALHSATRYALGTAQFSVYHFSLVYPTIVSYSYSAESKHTIHAYNTIHNLRTRSTVYGPDSVFGPTATSILIDHKMHIHVYVQVRGICPANANLGPPWLEISKL